MELSQFVDHLESIQKGIHRKITYKLVNGKKVPKDEHKNYPIETILKNRGHWSDDGIQCYSLYIKHIPNLYCIDYDQKDIQHSKLLEILKIKQTYHTETKKGFHYYVLIEGLPDYKNQINIGTENIAVDLLKDNNTWEHRDRKVFGTQLATLQWTGIEKFFDTSRMNFKREPSVEFDDLEITGDIPKCDKLTMDSILRKLDKKRYDYEFWLEVGIVLYNNFEGDMSGLQMWDEWSKKGTGYDGMNSLLQKWSSFSEDRNHKLSYKRLQKWMIEDNSSNPYEIAYASGGEDLLTKEMNKTCIFYKGNIILIGKDSYDQLKETAVRSHFKKYTFKVKVDGKVVKINPFNIWLDNFNRKDVDKIVFNPKDDSPPHHFNSWTGFKYQNTGAFDHEKIQPFLDLIYDVWADGDEAFYNYALNWFAHILQKPWKKNGVCIALQSRQGVGKTLVVSLIGRIIGESYYYTASSLSHILGNFNGDAEGKILVNLNECTWGGDKKMEGTFKEFITDESIVINRKGVNTYRVNNLANTIITTNSDWMVAVSKDDRRYNIRRCKNITPEEKETKFNKEYYKRVAQTDLQHLANFLYQRDISEYNPRDYERSQLHKEQVEKNMDTVEEFYLGMLNGEVYTAWSEPDFNQHEMYEKTTLYNSYNMFTKDYSGKYNQIYSPNNFWIQLKKVSNGGVLTNGKEYSLVDRNNAIHYYKYQ